MDPVNKIPCLLLSASGSRSFFVSVETHRHRRRCGPGSSQDPERNQICQVSLASTFEMFYLVSFCLKLQFVPPGVRPSVVYQPRSWGLVRALRFLLQICRASVQGVNFTSSSGCRATTEHEACDAAPRRGAGRAGQRRGGGAGRRRGRGPGAAAEAPGHHGAARRERPGARPVPLPLRLLQPRLPRREWRGGVGAATLGAFYLRVRGGKVAPLRPWVGDGAKWAKSAIEAHSASRHMEMKHCPFIFRWV